MEEDNTNAVTRGISFTPEILKMLEELAWMDRKNVSALVRWLITEEWTRRASAPVIEHQPQN